MRTQPDESKKTQSTVERRREERKRATGEVTICVNQGQTVLRGEMVDVSLSGFRMRYQGEPLDAGSEVEVTYPWGTVKARIMWLHVIAGWCDVGFLITEK